MSENSSSAQHIIRRDSVVEKDPDSTLNDVDDDCSLHLSDEEVQIEQSKKGRGMSFHYEGYPILMVGTVDLCREFHPYAIVITKTETDEDYKFMFSQLKSLAETIKVDAFDPKILLADTAAAITKQ